MTELGQVWDQPSKPLTEQVTDKSFKDNSEITEVEEIKSTPLRKRVRKVSSEKPEPQEAVLEEAAETKHTKSDKETTLQESKLPDSNLSTKELNVLEPEVKRTRVREPESDKSKHKASDLKEQTEEPKVKEPELKDTETPEPESKELKSTEPDIKEKEVTEVEIKEPIRRRRKPKADLIEETAASQVESSELKVEEPKEKEPEPKEKEPEVKDPVRRRRPKADLIEDTATSQVDTSELKVEEPKEKEPEPKEKEPEVKDPVRRRRRTKADIVEDTATSQSESSELKVEEPKEKEPEPKEKEPEVKDPVRRRRPKADIVEDTATSTLESSELKDTKVEEPKEQVSEVKEVEGTKSEVKEPIIRRRRTKPDQVEEATILSQSENITLNLPEVEDKTPDVTEKDNTDFKLQEPKKIESLGRRRPKPNTVDTDISQPEVISIPSPDLIDTKVKETDSELKESKIIESEVKDSLRKQSPKLDSAEEIVYSHKEPISLDPPKSEDPVLKDKKDITPEVKESEVTDIKVQKPQKKDSLRRKSKAEEVKEPEISQSESLNLQPLRKKSDPKVTTPKETETTVQKVKEPTAMDTSVPIVGLVDEDRTEFEGRHAHTSVAAAWRADAMVPPEAPSDGSKPVFTKSLVGNVVEPGEGATFICEVEHSSQYYVSWLKDNKVLDDKLADRVQQQDDKNKHVLRLMHCHLEDSGIYTAKATDPRGSSATSSAQLLVQELTEEEREARIAEKKPFFLVKMMATEVIENTNLSYAIHVKGDPMPKVTFFKDGKPLNEDGRVKVQKNEEQGKYELVIGHVQMNDAGLYKCVAMNKYEKAECEAMMNVVEEQETLQNLQGKGSLLKPGEEADFKWFRDGVEFDPVERFNVMFKDEEDTLALVFQNVTPDDAGIYTCVASTSCGKISCSAELTVEGSIKRLTKDPAPPRFVDHLADCFVAMAGTAMLECRISGYPQPELTWLHNGVEVKVGGRVKQLWEDDENVTLIIKNISDTDKGTYTVRASNELGDASSSANLVLRTVPKFRKIDKMVTCNVGDPLHFSVEVDGEPLPELKWMKDGKEIEPSDHIKFDTCTDGTFSMRIDKMKPDDCGTYCIVATNDMGQRTEQFEIAADTPPDITRGLDPETEKKYNNDHTFEVRAHGSPIPEATWYKDGRDLSSDDKYQISRDGKFYMLKIKNLSRHDKGIYKIVLKNRNGSAESEGELLIRTPPEFTTSLSDVYAKEGSKQIKLFVEWVSNPRSTTKWTYKDKEISDSTPGYTIKNTDTTSTLIIDVADLKSAGSYSITVSNEYGDRTTGCRFRLHEPPQVHEPLKDVEYLEDTQCKFQCKVTGVPIPEVKWEKDGQKWTPDESRVCLKKEGEEYYYILFEAAKTEDTAHYRANFSNVEGSIFTEGNILVNREDMAGNVSSTSEEYCAVPEHYNKANPSENAIECKTPNFDSNNEIELADNKDFEDFGNAVIDENEEESFRSKRDVDKYKVTGNNKLVMKSVDTEVFHGEYLDPDSNPISVHGILKNEDTRSLHKVEHITEGNPVISFGGSELPIIDIVDKETGESVRITASYSYRREQYPRETIITAACGLDDEEMDYTVATILKTKRLIEVEKCELLDDYEDEDLYLEDEKLPAILPADFIELDDGDGTENVSYEKRSSETKVRRLKEGVQKETPPHITRSNFRDGLTFIAMHKFVLEVEAWAVPEAEATWYLDGRELKEEEDSVKFSFDGKVYRMERIGSDPENTGEYKCTLKNKIATVDEAAVITIIEKEARVRKPLKTINVKEKTDGTIQCQIVGDPIPTVEWFRDGVQVGSSGRLEIKTDTEKRMHFLTFKNLEEEDKCTFTLKGINEHGECETSCVMNVYIVPRPGDLQDTVVDFGRDLLLSVKIHSIPHPDITWFKNGTKLDESDRVLYLRDDDNEVYSLEIKSTVVEDGATYSFKAVNEVGEASRECLVKIHTEKPTIATPLKNMEICLEDEVTFSIKCAALPAPEVEWTNKGKAITDDDRYSLRQKDNEYYRLTLRDVQAEDYGAIKFIAKNLAGEISSTAQLIQKKLPCEIIEGLENVTKGAEGEEVTLSVVIKGSPRPKFVWTKDGDEVEASANIKLGFEKKSYCEATISLTIVNAAAADSGQYRMRFFNEVNEEQTETALVVRPERKHPKISAMPKDLKVNEMEPGCFRCKISGYPKPDVKWLKDGRPVRPTDILNMGMTADGEYFLEFKNITLEDAGKYTLVATNEEGSTECDVLLNVNPSPSKPKFTTGLTPTKVIAGYPCRMEVQLDGFPKPQIAWLKDGEPVEIDGNLVKEIITDDGRVILQIDNASEGDAGEYTVVATNDMGETTSSASLGVLDHERKDGQPDGKPVFSEGLKDSCFDEGKTIKLPVCVKGGPVPDMKWYKGGKEIKLSDRCFYTYDGDKTYLEIHPCAGADSGKYKCVIQNPHGKEETQCEVTVRKCYESPAFTYTYPNQEQLPGKDAKFVIKVDGVPKPEISWFFKGKPIVPDGDKYRVRKDPDGCTLFVRNTTYSDTGAYKVIARNLEGKIEHEAKLLVADQVDPTRKSEAPAILKAIGDQELYEGYTAKFKAVVAGRPQPEFEWYRNGVKLFHSKRFISEMDEDGLIRLTIKYVCEEDAGVYELRVWNEHGKASCKGKLICECISKHKKRPVGDEYQGFDKIRTAGVPVPLPERPIISALSDRRCTLSWIPFMPAGPMPPVTYQVEMCEMPEGDWMTTSSGIRGCSVDILNLCPKSDYRFRVRVENKFGVSEPSPYVSTFRSRLEREPLSYLPHLDPMDDCIFEGPFVPSGFKIDRDPLGNFFAPPRFLRLDHDTQYGMKNFSGHVKWIGYGYPTPKLKFFYKEKEIRFGNGSRYSFTQEAEGEIFLFIDNLTEDDVGWYNCVAHNEYGESHQRIRLGLSEYPRVLQHLRETYIKGEGSGRIFCRISTYPQCDVTWYKDWHEIKPSMKLRPQFIEPDMYCLNFTGVSVTDTGLYSVAAVNVAGAVSSSCMVNVEDNEAVYNWYGFGRGFNVGINMRRGTLEDHYDIGDELGRGTQGIIYHCSERHSGRNFAAKSMWGKDQFKQWMHNEFEMMNYINSCPRVIRLHDAYESHKNMVLVTELCSGGELLHHLTEGQFYTEYEVAHYIKQVLEGLEYMHERFIAHLGLNIGDIMLTRPNGTDIKFGDLSLARNIRLKTLYALEYGMPEFVAPEVVKGEHVAYPADMWSVGIITYLLLSGTSPFKGEHDKETLTRIKKGELRFDVDAFSNLSAEAKDFIAKLLQFKQEHRLDVKSALVHPWIKFSEMTPHDPYKISTERLRKYYSSFKDWYGNASCRRWYRRRTLASAFTHPSKMVYPPGEAYTPPESPERALVPAKPLEDYRIPDHDLSYEVGDFKSDSNYQQGPDTYLLQLRDTEFPVRLRSYMNINRERSPIAMFTGRDVSYDYDRVPIVHERRRFTDIMDEEIKDERRRTMMDKYTAGFIRSKQTTCSLELPARVKNEVPAHLAIRDEPEFIKKGAEGKGTPPFIREKPSTTSVTPDMDITFTCVVSAEPEPIIQWFRNDTILGDTDRIKIKTTGGRSTLSITGCNDHDLGSYKILVRNWGGQAVHKFRLVRAEIPCMCEPPEVQEVSGTQVLLKWMSPLEDGGAQIEQYHLQFKLADKDEWSTVNDSITQEAYLVEGLSPNKPYQFRVAAKNIRGWGDFSVATPSIRTGIQDVADIKMPIEQKLAQNQKLQVLQLPGSRGEIRDQVDYSREIQPVPLKTGEGATLQMQKYQMIYEIARGRFSSIMRCLRPDDQRTFSCKINLRKDRGDAIKNEYEVAKSLRHERLATMYEAYELPEVTSFIIEYLGGPDVLTFLSDKLQYTEQHVSTVINQVLDGLSYLHWRGLCHLDIQPDNVVVTSHHKLDVKLVDFGNTQRVPSAGATVHVNGLLDYIAPEVLFDSTAFPTSDIWSLGVLTYVLLTGESPFEGPEEEQTLENIQCVRAVFETLGEHASQEATRFILLIFKRDPSKRPTEEECREHRWLAENDFMVKKRERTVLSITRLREYTKAYHKMRQRQASNSNIFSSFINKC